MFSMRWYHFISYARRLACLVSLLSMTRRHIVTCYRPMPVGPTVLCWCWLLFFSKCCRIQSSLHVISLCAVLSLHCSYCPTWSFYAELFKLFHILYMCSIYRDLVFNILLSKYHCFCFPMLIFITTAFFTPPTKLILCCSTSRLSSIRSISSANVKLLPSGVHVLILPFLYHLLRLSQ